MTWSWPTTARPMVSCSAPRRAAASFTGATPGIVPCALARSSNWRTGPLSFAGVDIAGEAEQLALLGSPRCERPSVGQQGGKPRARLRVGHRRRSAERGIVEVPVHSRRAPDLAFELVGVAGRDRSSLPAPCEELSHRDRKSTRLNSSHLVISYAVFCLKKKT